MAEMGVVFDAKTRIGSEGTIIVLIHSGKDAKASDNCDLLASFRIL
jgi:hypothetical protein